MFNTKTDYFPRAVLASIFLHGGMLGLPHLFPTSAQYPVVQASNSISVMLVEETPPLPRVEETVLKEESIEPEAIEIPTEEIKQAELQKETKEELGAMVEAVPLEYVNAAPEYPWLARRRGWEGTVVVGARVEQDGLPSSVEVQESSGYKILDDAAVAAIRQWRFKPAQSGRLTFRSTITIPVRFQLVERK